MQEMIWPKWVESLARPLIEGGRRLSGEIKSSSLEYPLISYVTVVRNAEDTLARTIQSVQSQTYKNVEHIVLDGSSTDGTLDVILSYNDKIDYYASEADKGLYDALNKAIPLCKGDLICVLNADDWLPPDAAELVAKLYHGQTSALILGAAQVESEGSLIHWSPHPVTLNSYFSIANCCHNAIYATKGAYLERFYDIKLKIASDFKWIMACFDAGAEFIYTDNVLVNYSLGGLSSDVGKHIEESCLIAQEKFPFLSEEEVALLNYTFYPWREHLIAPYADFRHEEVIEKLSHKYLNHEDFVNAIDYAGLAASESANSMFNRTKRLLRNYPNFYRLVKRIYYAIK